MSEYTKMQQKLYEKEASQWSLSNRDPVVGSFDKHNNWADYDKYLFKDLKADPKESLMLDFGCGPGRNIVKYNSKFKQIDGVDLAQNNLDNAVKWIQYNNCKQGNLYKNNGTDLQEIADNTYDVLMSVICFQHICVYDIRKNYLKEFNRVLKPGGLLTMQMGFGTNHPESVDYYENFYNAPGSNGQADTRVENPDQLNKDLAEAGFTNFNHYIAEVGPGDRHSNWIFFNATKLLMSE